MTAQEWSRLNVTNDLQYIDIFLKKISHESDYFMQYFATLI